MTRPRSNTVLCDSTGYYHCVSRCVRRAWLCGDDPMSGLNFDHRRGWIEARLLALCDVFSVAVYGYAVMSNHVHVVLRVDPGAPLEWSDREVATRWCALSRDIEGFHRSPDSDRMQRCIVELMLDDSRLQIVRQRLGSLSWFMRYLNEAIARAANQEDGCTGRFWEGRFRCQYLADEAALLGCMVYVDLNPVRAKMADSPAESQHTSVRRRLAKVERDPAARVQGLGPVAGTEHRSSPAMCVAEYLDLVEWTAARHRVGTPRASPASFPAELVRTALSATKWLQWTQSLEQLFGAAVGNRESLSRFARRTGRCWVRGAAAAG